MDKTKVEKITGIEEQIKQLENQRKKLIQEQKEQDRWARTKRLSPIFLANTMGRYGNITA